jgi:hypothetical protein
VVGLASDVQVHEDGSSRASGTHLQAPNGRDRCELEVSLVLGECIVDPNLVQPSVDLHAPALRVLTF